MEIERTMLSEYGDDNIMKVNLTLNGVEQEFRSPFANTPGTIRGYSSEKGDTLFIVTKFNFKNAG